MDNLVAVSEYIDKRNGMKRLFDQNGREYESLSGLSGLFDFLKPKDQGGSCFGNFLQKVGQTAVGIFKPKADGTLERINTQSLPGINPIAPAGWEGSNVVNTVNQRNSGTPVINPYANPYIPQQTRETGFGLDNKTLIIGGAVLVGGLLYALNKK